MLSLGKLIPDPQLRERSVNKGENIPEREIVGKPSHQSVTWLAEGTGRHTAWLDTVHSVEHPRGNQRGGRGWRVQRLTDHVDEQELHSCCGRQPLEGGVEMSTLTFPKNSPGYSVEMEHRGGGVQVGNSQGGCCRAAGFE